MADQVIDLQLSDPDQANKVFTKLLRKIRNDKEALLSVGQYFLDKYVSPCANQCAKQLYTIAPDYIPGLMFSGEVCMLRKDYGGAGQKFDEVLAIDSTYVPALRRNAFVYKNVNPYVAIETLQKIKRIDPQDLSTEKNLGDVYYNLSDYTQAVDNYAAYFNAKTNNDSTDVRSSENYLMSLFSTEKYEELGKLVERFAVLDPKDMVFKRMRFFAAVENFEQAKAQEAMGYITNHEYGDSLYVYRDYVYAARVMTDVLEEPNYPAAIEYLQKAYALDSTKVETLKDIARLNRQNKQFDEAISTYQKYLQLRADKADLSDKYGLGQHYLAASQGSDVPAEKKAEFAKLGDQIFADVFAQRSDYYPALVMRARINITDRSKAEATVKAIYEQALQVMEGQEGAESYKIEALQYLAFYAIQTDDNATALKYAKEMLSIEPDNAFAKKVVTFVEGMK